MPRPKRRPPAAFLDAAVVGLPLVILYLATVSHDLGTVDSGELAVVCVRLGIAHPTGYPLYTLLGRLALLVLPGSPIAALNLLSALCATTAAVLVAGLAREVWAAAPGPMGRLDLGPWLSRVAGLLLGTSTVFWAQATGNEVYALHLVFVVLLLRQGLSLLRAGATPRRWLLLAWVSGLALANHLSIVFLAPALLLCVASDLVGPARLRPSAGENSIGWTLGTAALTGLAAWTIVFYLPLRATENPILEWGAPDSWARFWRHLLGRQYSVWMFESTGQWSANVRDYFGSLPRRFSWPALALVLPGALAVARTRSLGRWVLALAFIVTVAWASAYEIHDLEPYYLPADLVLAMLAAAGLAALSRATRPVVLTLAALLVLAQAVPHFRAADRREDHFIRFHARATLEAMPAGAILFSRFWDAVVSPALYLQEVESVHRDATIVDVELLRRSWYYPQLSRWDAGLLGPIEDRVALFQQRVAVFEAGKPYDPASIEESYRSVIAGLARAHRPERATACTADAEAELRPLGVLVPEGLVYVLREGPQEARPIAPPDVDGLLRAGYRRQDPIHRMVVRTWAQAIAARIRFLEVMGRDAELPAWREAMRKIEPAAKAASESSPPS